MAVIRLTKEFSFEAAHALDGYDGPCREIHGHSYRLFVTVKGTPAEDASNPKCGMVLDFGVLVITFGLTIKITMASIIGVALALIIYRII